MNLLVITQKVDKDDDILGFFHGWLFELSKNCEKIFVVALAKGKCELPENVEIFSLGKEKGASKIRQAFNFYRLLFRFLPKSDGVFAHMCPEYVLAAAPLNLFFRKKIILWFIHAHKANWRLKLAEKFVYKILTSHYGSVKLDSPKVRPSGHGIDTSVFKRDAKIHRGKNVILILGRVSPVKKIETVLEACLNMDKEGEDFKLIVAGSPRQKNDFTYEKMIKEKAGGLIEKKKAEFLPSVKREEAIRLYNSCAIYINVTGGGSFDKTILEAMACETPVLVANTGFLDILPEEYICGEDDPWDVAYKIKKFFELKKEQKETLGASLREKVVGGHNLGKLAVKIIEAFE
jgi:glycosyltransferase involved in cell wall biosynthesis